MRVWKKCMVAMLSVLLVFVSTPGITFANMSAISFDQQGMQESETEDSQKEGGADDFQEGEGTEGFQEEENADDSQEEENTDDSHVEGKPPQEEEPDVNEELGENPTSMPAIQLNQLELMETEANIELQPLIESAAASETLTLEAGKIYSGTVTIDKNLTIDGKGATLKGTITNTESVTIRNLIIESPAGSAVKSTASLEMTECTVFGGVTITDNASIKAKLFKNMLHYNTVEGNAAVTILGTPEENVKHYLRYEIGNGNEEPPEMDLLKQNANTFVNDGNGDGPALVWPFTNTYERNDSVYRTDVHIDRLNAQANYWKKANGEEALFSEVKVGKNIKYANELSIRFKEVSYDGLAIPPVDFAYSKGVDYAATKGAYLPNTNTEYIEHSDNALVLFDRTFKTNGTSAPLFYEFEIRQANPSIALPVADLKQPHKVKVMTSRVHTDSNYGSVYTAEQLFSGNKFLDGSQIYSSCWQPLLPLDISPEKMVSYAGTTQALSKEFPQIWYDFRVLDLFYKTDRAITGEEYVQLKDIKHQFTLDSNVYTAAYLMTQMKDNSMYAPMVVNGTVQGHDENLDPDQDFFPFLPAFLSGDAVVGNNEEGGAYAITVGNAEAVSYLQYEEHFDTERRWRMPNLERNRSSYWDCRYLAPTFKTAELIIRPTSGNLTVEAVATTLPGILTHAVATVDMAAKYKDSTQRTVTRASVFLLDDKEEPDSNAYQYMMDTARTDAATKSRNYTYHFLSLLNKNDGNNVVTTPSEKTVFLPYPADYKVGEPIVMMHFEGYQRMPSDKISDAAVKIVKNEDLIKKEKGFTFTTAGDMGAYILAYGQQSSTTDPGTKPNPKPKPDPKPEEKPVPKPEEKPEPEQKPDSKPEVEKPIDKVVDEAAKNPDIIIRDKETLEEKYPGINLDDLPVPLYRGPDFVVIQMPNGELVAIDSELVPLGGLPQTDGGVVNQITFYCFGGAIVLLGIALAVRTRLMRKRKNIN